MPNTTRDLKLLTDSVSDVFWLCSADRSKSLYFSPAFERVWGRSPDPFYDNPLAFIETIHPADRHIVEADLAKQHSGQFAEEYSQEYRIVRPDGTIRWIWTRYIPVSDCSGVVVKVAGVSSDITSRKQLEQQLAQSQQELESRVAERMRALEAANQKLCNELTERRKVEESLQHHERVLAASPVALVMVNQAGQLVAVNRAFLHMWRYRSESHVLGRQVRDFFTPTPALPRLLDTLRLSAQQSGELLGVRRDASPLECEFSSAPVEAPSGTPQLYMAWLNDISERKLAERALAQREAFFSSLAELSIVGIHRADNEGNCTYVNQACCDLAGVRPEELLGNRWRQFLHPLDREQVLADWKQAAERHEKYDGVFRCVHADGHTIWVHSQSQPERAPNGNITGRVGTIMDVSRRILQEQEIRRLNRKLQEKVTELEALFHVIPIGLAIAEDAQCHVIRANRDFARVLQTPVSANVSFSGPESQRPSHFKIFSAGKEMLPREMPLQLATATGNSVRDCELQIAHEDGRSYNVLAFTTPLFDDRGVVRGAVGAFLDITERKRAEQSLAHRKRRLRDILNSMYVFVGQFATDGKVLETNKAALDVAKLSPDDVFGKYLWDTYWFSHSSTAERELKAVFQKVAGGESVRFDTMVRVGEAEFITIDATFSPLCDSQGHVVEAIGSAVDITKRLQDQQDLLRHREQLTHVLRLACLGEFATGIAHELSQPLMAISFSVQLLQVLCSEPTPNQPRIGETLDQLSSQSLRAGEILRHMRRLVRKAPNRAVPVNINSIIPAVISLAQPAARLASISLEFQPAEELPLVTVDSIQFEQVILNLLQNALEAIEAGGGKARRILITTSRHDADSICVSVADTGAGIPLSQMDSIFVAFHTTKPDGLGMGLAISRSIVEACGGQLLFDRTVHSGACFRVILPITAGISP